MQAIRVHIDVGRCESDVTSRLGDDGERGVGAEHGGYPGVSENCVDGH